MLVIVIVIISLVSEANVQVIIKVVRENVILIIVALAIADIVVVRDM